MERTQKSDIPGGKPHSLEILTPLLALPWSAPVIYLISCKFDTLQFAVISAAAAIISAAVLIISIRRRNKTMWGIDGNVLHFSRGITEKRDMSMRLDRISSSEIIDNPIYSLFGGARVRLYSSASPRPVFSMIIPKTQAAELINRTAVSFGTNGSVKPRYLIQKKYAALLAAITSRNTIIPLGASVILCIFGFGQTELYIIAAAFWLLAALHTIFSVLSECRMSVCRVNSGYVVQTGFAGERRIFIPDRAIIGMIETQTPIAAFAGTGKFELLCAGGRRVTCMNWYDGGNSAEAARRMIGCAGKSFAKISSPEILKRGYFGKLVLCLIACIAAWRVTIAAPPTMQGICASILAAVIASSVLHCITALKCLPDFGVTLSGGAILACGMNFMQMQHLTLRSGEAAFITLRQNFSDKLRSTCSASFSPRGHVHRIICRCLPYERFQTAAVKIISRNDHRDKDTNAFLNNM